MKTLDRLLTALILIFVFGVFTPTAHAYLDPGTGSIIVQAIIAGLAGSLLALKMFWTRITGFFSGLLVRNGKKKQ